MIKTREEIIDDLKQFSREREYDLIREKNNPMSSLRMRWMAQAKLDLLHDLNYLIGEFKGVKKRRIK